MQDHGRTEFVSRTEQKQEMVLSHKRKSKPSQDHIDALTSNLGSNQLGFQSEAMHDDKAKIAVSIGHTGAFTQSKEWVTAVGQQVDPKPKAKAKAKAMNTGTGVVLTGDLHNHRENVGLSLRGMLDIVLRDAGAALTQGQLCPQTISNEEEEELAGLRKTLNIRVKALSLWLGSKAKGLKALALANSEVVTDELENQWSDVTKHDWEVYLEGSTLGKFNARVMGLKM